MLFVPGASLLLPLLLHLIVSLWWNKITSVIDLDIGIPQFYFWLKFLGCFGLCAISSSVASLKFLPSHAGMLSFLSVCCCGP